MPRPFNYDGPLRTIEGVALWLERSPNTVRTWYRRGHLKHVACDVKTRAVLVDMIETQQLARDRPAADTPITPAMQRVSASG